MNDGLDREILRILAESPIIATMNCRDALDVLATCVARTESTVGHLVSVWAHAGAARPTAVDERIVAVSGTIGFGLRAGFYLPGEISSRLEWRSAPRCIEECRGMIAYLELVEPLLADLDRPGKLKPPLFVDMAMSLAVRVRQVALWPAS